MKKIDFSLIKITINNGNVLDIDNSIRNDQKISNDLQKKPSDYPGWLTKILKRLGYVVLALITNG